MTHDGLEDFDIDLARSLLKRVQPFLENHIMRLEKDMVNAKSVFDARSWSDAMKRVAALSTEIDLYLNDDPEEEDEG